MQQLVDFRRLFHAARGDDSSVSPRGHLGPIGDALEFGGPGGRPNDSIRVSRGLEHCDVYCMSDRSNLWEAACTALP